MINLLIIFFVFIETLSIKLPYLCNEGWSKTQITTKMNRTTKTTLAVFAIVAGISIGAFAQKKTVRLDPVSKDLYRLTYIHQGKCNLKVEVVDANGKKLLSEQIDQKKSFTKPYSFKNLEQGEYSFVVTDNEGVYVSKINRNSDYNMTADIRLLDDDKAKVIVKGSFMEPVYVNILDKHGLLIFDDYIEHERSFSKVYDLSKIDSDHVEIVVVTQEKLLAKREF